MSFAFPPHYTTVEIGHQMSREVKEHAARIIAAAKEDIAKSALPLRGKNLESWSGGGAGKDIFSQPRKKVEAAFNEFKSIFENKYGNSSDEGVKAIMWLAITHGRNKYFHGNLEDELRDIMKQVLSAASAKPQDPPEASLR